MKKRTGSSPRIGVVADVHLGNFAPHGGLPGKDGLNDRGQLTVETLRRALALAEDRGCRNVYVAGDLFQSRRPEPAVVAAAQRALGGVGGSYAVVPGNHDLVDASPGGGNTACETLALQVFVPREPRWERLPGLDVLLVPFTSEVPMHQHLRDVLSQDMSDMGAVPRVLVTHIGVTDESTAPWLKGKPDAIDAKEFASFLFQAGFDGAFVGNYHRGQIWKFDDAAEACWICQVGTLCPATHSDEGVFPQVGGLATWAPGEELPTLHEVPGPRFLTLNPEDHLPALPEGCRAYVRARVSPDGDRPNCAGAAGVTEVPAVSASELGPVPDKEIEGAEQAILEWSKANAVPPEVAEMALSYWRKSL